MWRGTRPLCLRTARPGQPRTTVIRGANIRRRERRRGGVSPLAGRNQLTINKFTAHLHLLALNNSAEEAA
jgi:hypothetical protein